MHSDVPESVENIKVSFKFHLNAGASGNPSQQSKWEAPGYLSNSPLPLPTTTTKRL